MFAKRAWAALAGLIVMIGVPSRGLMVQSGGAAAAGKMTEEVYKNIQVLKGIPADQLPPTMQFVAASLGERCTFCHVEGANEKDDKETKQTARKMMQMVLAINKDNFDGRTQVTCYSCHRGNESPVGTPVISDAGPPPEPPREAAASGAGGEQQATGPTAAQLLDKYLAASGGADALAKISSRIAKGNALAADGGKTPVEIYSKGSDKRVMITHAANGDRSTGYNGNFGWTTNAAGAPRDMSAADLEGSKLEDDLYLATHAQQIYSQWRVGRPQKVGGRDCYVLNGSAPGHVPLRLYLDQQTGMLLRLIRYTETPLGRLPAQVDFADYRGQDGVKVPYRLILARPAARTTVQLDQVQQNVAVDDSKFTKPADPPRP